MREIKFRAWSPERKGFVLDCYPIGIADKNGFRLCGVGEGEGCQDTEDDGLILEQYTGIKDKNGVDIYEGDKVEFEIDGFMSVGIIKFNHQRAGFIIKHQIPPFRATYTRDFNVTYGDGTTYIDSTINVIGNIHQNPELL